MSSNSLNTEARGTKKGSNRSRDEEPWKPSPKSPCCMNSHGRCVPWMWRCAAQALIASRSHTSLHNSEGAKPLVLRCVRSAPLCINSIATLRRPMKRATCSGVHPAQSVESKGNCRRMNSRTIAMDPLRHAAWRHVVPFVSHASTLAPSANSHLMAGRFDEEANTSKSLSTSLRSSSVSLNTAPAGSHVLKSSNRSVSPAGWSVALGHMLELQKARLPMVAGAPPRS
mmetsp:Transcript_93715/g.269959  ORF Transcript_93715/g.269959 Transcript_93715/m.269959 type:complete len:227 (+) Transcript_93715:765-1445(+)